MVFVVVAGTHDEKRMSNAGSMLLVGPAYPTSISLISPHADEFQTSDIGAMYSRSTAQHNCPIADKYMHHWIIHAPLDIANVPLSTESRYYKPYNQFHMD